jgi:hypothetical protein
MMAVIAQIGFEIRAPRASRPELFESIRNAYWEELAGWELGLETETRETAEGFLAHAEVSEDDGPVMRYFCPYWRLNGPLDHALDALAELFSEERGFSGAWRYLLDEGCYHEYRYWGEDERPYAALRYDFVLRPSWTHYGVHLDHNDLYNLLREEGGEVSLSDQAIERLSMALDPKVKDIIRATALDLGMVRDRDRLEASG